MKFTTGMKMAADRYAYNADRDENRLLEYQDVLQEQKFSPEVITSFASALKTNDVLKMHKLFLQLKPSQIQAIVDLYLDYDGLLDSGVSISAPKGKPMRLAAVFKADAVLSYLTNLQKTAFDVKQTAYGASYTYDLMLKRAAQHYRSGALGRVLAHHTLWKQLPKDARETITTFLDKETADCAAQSTRRVLTTIEGAEQPSKKLKLT